MEVLIDMSVKKASYIGILEIFVDRYKNTVNISLVMHYLPIESQRSGN